MLEWIGVAAGIGFGLIGLGTYIKENLEAKQREQEYQRRIKELTATIAKGQLIDKQRVITEDKRIITDAKEKLWILGINALGPLHEAREDIISLLNRGGNVRILLLNLKSKAFEQREKDEGEIKGQTSGRLRAEYIASVAICKDIVHFSSGRGTFELRIHNKYPSWALVIADPQSDKAKLHVNYYPKEKLTRGYIGEHRVVLKEWPDVFHPWLQEYELLWNKATKVDLERKLV